MIMRSWRGSTTLADAEAYYQYIQETGIKGYQSTPGNRGVYVLRRTVDGRAEFLLLSLWDSMEAIHRFAGPDPERAVFYPEDERFLVEFDRTVNHYEVLFQPGE